MFPLIETVLVPETDYCSVDPFVRYCFRLLVVDYSLTPFVVFVVGEDVNQSSVSVDLNVVNSLKVVDFSSVTVVSFDRGGTFRVDEEFTAPLQAEDLFVVVESGDLERKESVTFLLDDEDEVL